MTHKPYQVAIIGTGMIATYSPYPSLESTGR